MRIDMDNNILLNNILVSLKSFFGSLENPNFSEVQETYERDPHNQIIVQLTAHFVVEDVTDLNTDVAVVLSLISNREKSRQFRIELSLIDKYIALFSIKNRQTIPLSYSNKETNEDIETILSLSNKGNYTLIPGEILDFQIPFNRPNSNGTSTVYQAVFSDAEL